MRMIKNGNRLEKRNIGAIEKMGDEELIASSIQTFRDPTSPNESWCLIVDGQLQGGGFASQEKALGRGREIMLGLMRADPVIIH
jgi:hypothetical protein